MKETPGAGDVPEAGVPQAAGLAQIPGLAGAANTGAAASLAGAHSVPGAQRVPGAAGAAAAGTPARAVSVAAAAASWLVAGITVTPALRGFAGGPGLPEADGEPGGAAAAGAGGTAAGDIEPGGIEPGGTAGGSVPGELSSWQRAQRVWAGARVDWVREPGWLPERAWSELAAQYRIAGQEHPVAGMGSPGMDPERTQPIPAVSALASTAPRRARTARARTARAKPGPVKAGPAEPGGMVGPAKVGPAKPGGAVQPGRRPAQPPHGRRSAARRPAARVTAAVVSLAVIGLAAIITVALARHPAGTPRHTGLLPGYPPARLADATFAAGAVPAGTSLPPSLSTIAAAGSTVVAAGHRAGSPVPRPVILVSTDGGAGWQLASLHAPGGAATGGAGPFLLAGGPRGWLALGTRATWLSPAGHAWDQEPGIPLRRGDRVLSLAGTAAGWVAAGTNTADGRARASGIVWTSADGVTWQRRTAGRLGLRAGKRRVAALDQVAARGRNVVITGRSVPARSHARGRRLPAPAYAWRSGDGGATWAGVRVPAGHGATGVISGVAADQAGFTLIRPGRAGAVAYQSRSGTRWRFASALTGARRGSALRITRLTGNGNGAVLTATEKAGRAAGADVAFVTRTGRSWHRVLLLSSANGGALAGAAAGPGGTVVAAGSAAAPHATGTAGAAAARRPVLVLAGHEHVFTGQQALARAATAGITVKALASGAGRDVAVGSVAGEPVIWTAPAGGHWSADPAGTWAVPGLTLSGVTYGDGRWLARGEVGTGSRSRQVLLASGDGRNWQTVPGPGQSAGPGAVIAQAAVGRGGFVLVGRYRAGGKVRPAAWWSATPGTWSQAAVTTATAPAGTPGSGQAAAGAAQATSGMLAVTARGPGFVAVGALGSQPAAWSSADGRAWTAAALPIPAGATGAVLQQVASQGRRVAAVGTETTAAGPVPFVAVSADTGQTWREYPLPLPACQRGSSAGPPAGGVSALAAAGTGFVATGTCGPAGRSDVVVWSSTNGRTWTAAVPHRAGLSGPGAQQITSLTVSGRFLTGVGYTATTAAAQVTLWQLRLR